jgi:hypothetical protein
VPQLGGDPVPAAEELAIEHDRAAHAGAHREHDHVVDVAAGAEAELGPSGRVGVVLDRDGHVDPGLERGLERLVAPGDVGRVDHGRPIAIDEAGGGHPDGGDLVTGREVARHVDDGSGQCGGVDGSVDAELLDDAAVGVDDPSGDLRSADVDTDLEHRVPLRPARARRRHAV